MKGWVGLDQQSASQKLLISNYNMELNQNEAFALSYHDFYCEESRNICDEPESIRAQYYSQVEDYIEGGYLTNPRSAKHRSANSDIDISEYLTLGGESQQSSGHQMALSHKVSQSPTRSPPQSIKKHQPVPPIKKLRSAPPITSKANLQSATDKTSPPRKEDEARNVPNHVLRKAARQFDQDSALASIVQPQLRMIGKTIEDFQEFLLEISLRTSTSNRDLVYIFLNPKPSSRNYQMKLIFAGYFKHFLEYLLLPSLMKEKQIKNKKLYISHARHCLAYLKDVSKKKKRIECGIQTDIPIPSTNPPVNSEKLIFSNQ